MWLIKLVENLLAVTRLENDGLDLRLQPELLDEVIKALRHIDRRSARVPHQRLAIRRPADGEDRCAADRKSSSIS
ncbi:MAG: hypothetical protein V8T36_08295 [Ruthenibacterium lactatiformans]